MKKKTEIIVSFATHDEINIHTFILFILVCRMSTGNIFGFTNIKDCVDLKFVNAFWYS